MSGEIEDLKNHVMAMSKKLANFCDGFLNSKFSNERINEILDMIHKENHERSRTNTLLFEQVYPDLARRVAMLEENMDRLLHPERYQKNDILEKSIHDLELTVRSTRCLENEQIHTIGDLIKNTAWELRRIPNMGAHSVKNIEESLSKFGLKLKDC